MIAASTRSLRAADRVIVALDVPGDRVRPLVESLGNVRIFKVGMEAYYREGGALVRWLVDRGHDVFVDLKIHDIPNTAARATAEIAALGARFLTLHASGGPEMLSAAVESAKRVRPEMTCLGVTVLTSLTGEELPGVWDPETSIEAKVARLGRLAVDAGCGGIVASPLEAGVLRGSIGAEPLLVCPGIRPKGASAGDQRRVATPALALREGADHLVIGRPITGASDPAAAYEAILAEIRSA